MALVSRLDVVVGVFLVPAVGVVALGIGLFLLAELVVGEVRLVAPALSPVDSEFGLAELCLVDPTEGYMHAFAKKHKRKTRCKHGSMIKSK